MKWLAAASLVALLGCGTDSGFSGQSAAPTPAPVGNANPLLPDGQRTFVAWGADPHTACSHYESWHCGPEVPTPNFPWTDGSGYVPPTPCS